MSTPNPAAFSGTPCFCLSEAQELKLYRVRHTLAFITDLADAIPTGSKLVISPEGLSCLLSSLAESIPTTAEMPFIPKTGERP
jgi:hypothetical protein